MATLLLFTFYTADLTSRFTAITEEPVLKTFSDAVTHGYKVLVNRESIGRSILKDSKPGSGLHGIQNEIIMKNKVCVILGILLRSCVSIMLVSQVESNYSIRN